MLRITSYWLRVVCSTAAVVAVFVTPDRQDGHVEKVATAFLNDSSRYCVASLCGTGELVEVVVGGDGDVGAGGRLAVELGVDPGELLVVDGPEVARRLRTRTSRRWAWSPVRL